MWVCLEDIFPVNIQQQAGLDSRIGAMLSAYVVHAYVLHGPALDYSMAWQLSLKEGQEQWSKVLMEAQKSQLPATATHEEIVEWGKGLASRVEGMTSITTAPGIMIRSQSKRCFRTSHPVGCTDLDVQSFSQQYFASHQKFNLLTNNCVMYACALVDHCSKKSVSYNSSRSTCDLDTCQHELMYNPISEKDPKCHTKNVPDFDLTTPLPPAPVPPTPQTTQTAQTPATPNKGSNNNGVLAAGAFSNSLAASGNSVSQQQAWSQYLSLFMPMHSNAASNVLANVMLSA